jgi:hypothetical protein
MTRILIAGALFIVAMALDPGQARADDRFPWCAVVSIGAGNIMWDCHYRSVEECAPDVVAGNRGTCNPNPRYEPPIARPKIHGKRRVKQQ